MTRVGLSCNKTGVWRVAVKCLLFKTFFFEFFNVCTYLSASPGQVVGCRGGMISVPFLLKSFLHFGLETHLHCLKPATLEDHAASMDLSLVMECMEVLHCHAGTLACT